MFLYGWGGRFGPQDQKEGDGAIRWMKIAKMEPARVPPTPPPVDSEWWSQADDDDLAIAEETARADAEARAAELASGMVVCSMSSYWRQTPCERLQTRACLVHRIDVLDGAAYVPLNLIIERLHSATRRPRHGPCPAAPLFPSCQYIVLGAQLVMDLDEGEDMWSTQFEREHRPYDNFEFRIYHNFTVTCEVHVYFPDEGVESDYMSPDLGLVISAVAWGRGTLALHNVPVGLMIGSTISFGVPRLELHLPDPDGEEESLRAQKMVVDLIITEDLDSPPTGSDDRHIFVYGDWDHHFDDNQHTARFQQQVLVDRYHLVPENEQHAWHFQHVKLVAGAQLDYEEDEEGGE